MSGRSHLYEDGRIARLDVLMRPLNGIKALREAVAPRMQEFLASRASS